MIIHLFPEKDATLYEVSASMNTGIDQALELEKVVTQASTPKKFNSRIVQKYDISTVSASIVDGTIGLGFKAYLNLHTFEEYGIPYDHEIYAYPLSQSFSNGTGRKLQSPKNFNGVSWQYRNYSTTTNSGDIWATASFASTSTGSFTENAGGGTWYTSSAASQSFSGVQTDVRMDVTDIVKGWLSGSRPNDGFMIKRSTADESSGEEHGRISFFSMDTNTIFPPKLEFAWDDSSFSTGSLSELEAEDKIVYFKNLRREYVDGERVRFRIVGRERYPSRSYTTTLQSLDTNYLPTSSYYAIKDAHTDDFVVPYDTSYTKISCDASGSFFDIRTDGLQPNRYFRLLIKTERNGLIDIYDDGFFFKIKKN
jgi:hypothetical protein|tara:strand:+ start:19 stop:1119 length:1101 start_codon:yes stop_codon:yes gene_type:complete